GATLPSPSVIYYVDCAAGDDSRIATQAKNAATPWRTIKNALSIADGGDTVMVVGGTPQAPSTCGESSIESKRPGRPGAPLTIKAATPGAVMVRPTPPGNGFLIRHDYHVIDGFVITGATNGVQVQGTGALTGTVISGNRIAGNTQAGIKASGAIGVAMLHNVINNN